MALVEKTFGQVITFSRASNATRFASNGQLQYAPHNLLTYSEQFDNATWTKGLSSITANDTVSPDGQVTADKLVEDTSTGQHLARQTNSGLSSGSTLTLSVYLKAAERTTSQLYINDNATTGNRVQANFDLSAGTTSSASNFGTFTGATSSITSVGNGWYRCVLTGVATGVTSVQSRVIIGTTSYTGNGTSGIYVWGAQLAIGPYPLTYTPTTTAAVYGPRFDYDPVTLIPKGILIEEQRTNLLTYSEQFDNAAWTKLRSSITANTIVAPDGTLTGDKLVPNTDNNTHVVAQSLSITSGTTYTISLYAKQGEIRYIRLGFGTNGFGGIQIAFFDLLSGVVTSTLGTVTTSITNTGNGWWRLSVTATATSTATGEGAALPSLNGTSSSFVGDGYSGIYLWGAQLEAGAFPTSYIPTVASQVTRSADSATINTLSPWFNAAGGTIYIESVLARNAISREAARFDDATANEVISVGWASGSGAEASVVDGGVTQASISPSGYSTVGVVYKRAFAFASNDFEQVIKGVSVGTDTSGTLPTVTRLGLGATAGGLLILNGYIRRFVFYPRRLTSGEMKSITA